jgi:hypothetical protein
MRTAIYQPKSSVMYLWAQASPFLFRSVEKRGFEAKAAAKTLTFRAYKITPVITPVAGRAESLGLQ